MDRYDRKTDEEHGKDFVEDGFHLLSAKSDWW